MQGDSEWKELLELEAHIDSLSAGEEEGGRLLVLFEVTDVI